ncbi:hypothetical protein D3C84_1231920 [compost metagenome]
MGLDLGLVGVGEPQNVAFSLEHVEQLEVLQHHVDGRCPERVVGAGAHRPVPQLLEQ